MTKCKTIDRLQLTRQSSRLLHSTNTAPLQPIGDICPNCKQYTLQHVEGCETCYACGYSACAINP